MLAEAIIMGAGYLQGLAGKYDPVDAQHRNGVMLALNINIARTGRYVPLVPNAESRQVSQPQADFSQQTIWMLAVRDNRDRTAFSALFDHFAPRLKGVTMRLGASSQQAEEVVQDVMLSVWRKASLFDPHRAQVSAWIYQIARNRQIDLFRKERRPEPEAIGDDSETEPDASQIMAMEQEASRLRTAIARLTHEQREMIEKAYLGELSHQEIQDQTGLPLGTIKSRIRLGLDRLRHELKGMR